MMSGAGAVELAALSLLWWLVEMAGQDAEPICVCQRENGVHAYCGHFAPLHGGHRHESSPRARDLRVPAERNSAIINACRVCAGSWLTQQQVVPISAATMKRDRVLA